MVIVSGPATFCFHIYYGLCTQNLKNFSTLPDQACNPFWAPGNSFPSWHTLYFYLDYCPGSKTRNLLSLHTHSLPTGCPLETEAAAEQARPPQMRQDCYKYYFDSVKGGGCNQKASPALLSKNLYSIFRLL